MSSEKMQKMPPKSGLHRLRYALLCAVLCQDLRLVGGLTMAEYIERKALINELSASCIPIDNREISGLLGCNESIRDIIDAIPAADVRPERHGEWLLDDSDEYANHYHCSVCGVEKDTCNEIYDEPPPNYCENCGAKMDGKGE